MKKLILLLLLLSACSISYAESMKFITVLSSPVGTFNKLEAVDPDQPAKGNTVNFCTNIGTQGLVELKGTKPAALTTVSLANNTTLGKTDEGKFSLNNITLKQGGSIKGGRLFGNTLKVDYKASGKANNLYGNKLTVAGAKTKTLDVNSGASKINGPGNSTGKEEMVWSNEYQEDDACKSGSACAKQYLLKSKGNNVSTSPSCETNFQVNDECCEWVWNNKKGSAEFNSCWKASGGTVYTMRLKCEYLGPGTYAGLTNSNKSKYSCNVKRSSLICPDLGNGEGVSCSANLSQHTEFCVFSFDGGPYFASNRWGQDQDAYYFNDGAEAQRYFSGFSEEFGECASGGTGCYAVYQYRECTASTDCAGRKDGSVCYVRK